MTRSAYRLSAGSRSRRRLAMLQSESAEVPELETAGSDDAAGSWDIAPDPLMSEVEETESLRVIRRLVLGSRPANWVFCGDGITHAVEDGRTDRSFPELFAQRVRWDHRRLLDTVITTAASGTRCAALAASIELQALRFRPDVVAVLLGLTDSLAGPGGRETFEAGLNDLVDQLTVPGAVVLMQTPHRVLLKGNERYTDLPAYVEIIRHVAAATEVILVDHWADWGGDERMAADWADWLLDDGRHPNGRGHRRMAGLLSHVLGIGST